MMAGNVGMTDWMKRYAVTAIGRGAMGAGNVAQDRGPQHRTPEQQRHVGEGPPPRRRCLGRHGGGEERPDRHDGEGRDRHHGAGQHLEAARRGARDG